jgi:hypothetical protein
LQVLASWAELLRLTEENGAAWLPDPPIQRSEDKDPTHTIARISFSDLEDDEAILSDVVIFASISICH